ncbi:hypothetical protein HZS_2724 [Henneguya salminicola]|nr:hypothetical protein HZS_2724 [Henneguya salminicola]
MNNTILIMGNVIFHKTVETQTTIINAQFEQIYSPFLNPIEYIFSKSTEQVKRGSPKNKTKPMNLIKNGSKLITSEDVEGYHQNMSSYITRCVNGEEIFD